MEIFDPSGTISYCIAVSSARDLGIAEIRRVDAALHDKARIVGCEGGRLAKTVLAPLAALPWSEQVLRIDRDRRGVWALFTSGRLSDGRAVLPYTATSKSLAWWLPTRVD